MPSGTLHYSQTPDQIQRQSAAVSELQWLTAADLAAVLGLKRQTIYNKLQTASGTLPPISRVPYLRGPRWSQRAVREFQAKFDPPSIVFSPARRGRPTKAEQMARRNLSAQA